MPLAFEPGEAFQFDWSGEYAFIGGVRRRLEVAHVKLNVEPPTNGLSNAVNTSIRIDTTRAISMKGPTMSASSFTDC